MTTRTVRSGVAPLRSTPFETFAGVCAILSGVIGFLYAVAFVVLQNILLSGLFLMLVGLLSTAVLTAVYDRLRETEIDHSRADKPGDSSPCAPKRLCGQPGPVHLAGSGLSSWRRFVERRAGGGARPAGRGGCCGGIVRHEQV